MALEKTSVIDKIEVVGEWKHIQIREKIQIKDGDQVISESFNRWFISPDHEGELSGDVKKIANSIWTATHKNKYSAWVEEQAIEFESAESGE
jgi:hypothetical protein